MHNSEIGPQRMNGKQRIFRVNGLVAFHSFVADLFPMCGTEDLEIKSFTIKIFEEPFLSKNDLILHIVYYIF